MDEYKAIADLLKAVWRVKMDVQMQAYGVEGANFWEARVDPLIMDELLDAYEACLVAQEDE